MPNPVFYDTFGLQKSLIFNARTLVFSRKMLKISKNSTKMTSAPRAPGKNLAIEEREARSTREPDALQATAHHKSVQALQARREQREQQEQPEAEGQDHQEEQGESGEGRPRVEIASAHNRL